MRDFKIGFVAAFAIASVFLCGPTRGERAATPAATCTIGQAPGRLGR